MKYIKLYEDFKPVDIQINYKRDVELTFRFLLKPGVTPENLHRKIVDRFIKKYNPPFMYRDIVFHSFDMHKIGDIPTKNRIESEYTIRATVEVNIDGMKPMTVNKIDKMIRRGMTTFIKLEEDKIFNKEIESSVVVSYEIYDLD